MLCLLFSVPFVVCIMSGKDKPQDGTVRFMVSIKNQLTYNYCSGALIAFQFVLTAASCVNGTEPSYLTLTAGIVNLNDQDAQDLRVEEIFTKKPTGKNLVHNNIALLRLTKPIEGYKSVYPINLPKKGDDDRAKEGEWCYTYGWGQKYVSLGIFVQQIFEFHFYCLHCW